MLKRSSKEARSEIVRDVRAYKVPVIAMKNISFALLALFVGLLPACSGGQDSSTTGATPTPTVTVPPTEPVVEKPKDDKPAGPEETPPPEEAAGGNGRLALQQCSEESRKSSTKCATILKPVCAEVDTGLRCVRAPCPSTAQQTFDNECIACLNKNVRGFWPMSCEAMAKPTAP